MWCTKYARIKLSVRVKKTRKLSFACIACSSNQIEIITIIHVYFLALNIPLINSCGLLCMCMV